MDARRFLSALFHRRQWRGSEGCLVGNANGVWIQLPALARHSTDGAWAGIGHSGIWCVVEAAKQYAIDLKLYNFWEMPSALKDGVLAPELCANLAKGPVVSFVGGGAPSVLAIAQHPEPFDFVLPEAPDLPLTTGAQIIPYDAMRAVLTALNEPYLSTMRQVRDASGGTTFHVEGPPPVADPDRMGGKFPWSLHPGMLKAFSPRWLRLKVWRLQSAIIHDFCAEEGLVFVTRPPGVADADGFLREEFFKDAVHANAAYGALVIEQVRALL